VTPAPARRGEAAALLALALLLLVAVAHGQAPRRLYHRVTIEQLAAGRVPWPYAQLIGRVRMVRTEQDGDLHIKLTGTTAFVVLEVIPEMPLARPTVGARIRDWGIPRVDKEHGWWELHPLLGWEAAP